MSRIYHTSHVIIAIILPLSSYRILSYCTPSVLVLTGSSTWGSVVQHLAYNIMSYLVGTLRCLNYHIALPPYRVSSVYRTLSHPVFPHIASGFATYRTGWLSAHPIHAHLNREHVVRARLPCPAPPAWCYIVLHTLVFRST